MNILFLGGIFHGKMKEEIISNSTQYIQYAADKFQWNFINGLETNGANVTILNMPFVGVYPISYKKSYVEPYEFSHNGKSSDVSIGFFNFRLIHKLFKYLSLRKQVKRWKTHLQKDNNFVDVVLLYSVDSVFLNIAKLIKKVNPSIHICLIAPDLPEYMSLNEKQSLLTRLSRAVDLFLINKSLNIVDSFVLITEHMKDPLKVGNRPYVVVEGMVPTNSNSDVLERNKKEKIKSILYTGTLIKKYGILQLLSAFSLIDDENYRLIICGSGEAEAEIKANCKLDKRVSFMGLLAPERIKDLQEKATVLVNPRQNDNSFTKYSFPSKIMEYLISGTATVAYKLSGMPDEYTKYIFYIEGDSPQDMADKLIYVCEMDPSMRNQFANNARNYVLSNKNNVSQTQKIFKMFKDTGIK